MAQHGYAREYDEDFDRGEDRERGWRDRDWEARDRDWRDRDRGFMFGDEERERFGDRGEDRFSSRGDQVTSYGREHGFGGFQGDYGGGREQGGFGGSGEWDQGRRSYSSRPDDHYRSWRQKQIDALDRDYADYCREREQQFHSDFDSWRSRRQSNPEPLRAGMTQTGLSADPSGMTQAEGAAASATPEGETDPTGTATLGTTSRGRSQR